MLKQEKKRKEKKRKERERKRKREREGKYYPLSNKQVTHINTTVAYTSLYILIYIQRKMLGIKDCIDVCCAVYSVYTSVVQNKALCAQLNEVVQYCDDILR